MSSKNVLVHIRVVYIYGMKLQIKMIVPGKDRSSHFLGFLWVLFSNPNRVSQSGSSWGLQSDPSGKKGSGDSGRPSPQSHTAAQPSGPASPGSAQSCEFSPQTGQNQHNDPPGRGDMHPTKKKKKKKLQTGSVYTDMTENQQFFKR